MDLSDVVDAAIVLLCNDGDDIVTSDTTDFEVLVRARRSAREADPSLT